MSSLNVVYEPRFYDEFKSLDILNQLLHYPFESIELKIKGKTCTPLRKVCAFADPEVFYSFSGCTIRPHPWTSLLLDIRQDLELKFACEFNYVLLNYYETGTAKIGSHADDETCLDTSVPISTLSFGASRTLQFTSKDAAPVSYTLESGSLLVMYDPTNTFWMHGIEAEPHITEPRISLTFRKIVVSTEPAPKRLRLEPPAYEVLHKFPLGDNIFVVVQLFHKQVCVHIRKYFQNKYGNVLPTKSGVHFTMECWLDFVRKLRNISLVYTTESSVFDNSVIGIVVNHSLRLHQFASAYKLHEQCVTLQKGQFDTLQATLADIRTFLIEYLYTEKLPSVISSPLCTETDLYVLREAIENHLQSIMRKKVDCAACKIGNDSQRRHVCINYTPKELYDYFKEDILCMLDTNEILFEMGSTKFSCKSNFYGLIAQLFQ